MTTEPSTNPYESTPQSELASTVVEALGPVTPVFILTLILLVSGILVLCALTPGFVFGFLLVPFALGPLLINLSQANYWRSSRSQNALLVGTVLYASWFTFVFLSAVVFGADAQPPIALAFVGIYSLPVMLPIWIIAGVMNRSDDRRAL